MTPQILLFDLYGGGHHGFYLDVLRTHWHAQSLPGHLHVAVSTDFAARHSDVLEPLRASSRATVRLLDGVPPNASLLQRDRLHGRLFRQMVEATGATHAAFLYWDHAQLSTALRLHFHSPVALAGVYFRPSFHYGTLGGPRPGWADRVLAARKKLVLRAALRNAQLRHLFCLDPFAVAEINRLARRDVALFLPDPVRVPEAAAALPGATGPGRRRLLIFGVLDHRKGIVPTCRALLALPAQEQCRLALVLAGPVEGPDAPEVHAALEKLRRETSVEVLLDDRFVPDAEIQHLIEQADLVLLTYQQHIGSSNVLVRAAAARVPVLATHYGLVGAQVRQHHLGITVDATDPNAIRSAIQTWLGAPRSIALDPGAAQAFADANTAEACAATFWNRLLSSVNL